MENKHKAKKEMLEKLRKIMGGMGADKAMGGVGVTVKAKDKEGLLEGLSKAGDIVESEELPEDMMEEMPEEMEEYDEEMPEEEMSEDYEEMSKEDLIELLKNR